MYDNSLNVNKLTREFVDLFADDELKVNERSFLIELLPVLQREKKNEISKLYRNFRIGSCSDVLITTEEKELIFYVSGRVIRTLYYKTRNSFFMLLKHVDSSGDTTTGKALWEISVKI